MNAAPHSLPPIPAAVTTTAAYLDPEPPQSLLVPVDMKQLRALPPPPPRTAVVPAVRFGVTLAAIGGILLVAALFVTPWLQVKDIIVPQPPQAPNSPGLSAQGGGNTNNNSFFSARFVLRDMKELGAVGWASTRREPRTVAVVTLALMAEAFALMSMVTVYRWRLLVGLAGLAAIATPSLALLDLLRIDELIRHRALSVTNGTTPIPPLEAVAPQPGYGMIGLCIGAAVVVIGMLVAFFGGRRSQILAHMPAQ